MFGINREYVSFLRKLDYSRYNHQMNCNRTIKNNTSLDFSEHSSLLKESRLFLSV